MQRRTIRAVDWFGPAAVGPLVVCLSYVFAGHYLGKSICIISGCLATVLGLIWGLSGCSPKHDHYIRIALKISAVFVITAILILTR